MLTTLLIAGFFFPAISLLSATGSAWQWWRHKKQSSAVLIPFIGPLLLTGWVILSHTPHWVAAVFWGSDLGTIAFLAASPRLISDWWRTSYFTRILTLNGSVDNQRVIITLHATGHYVTWKAWIRPREQSGIVQLGEPGTFTQDEGCYTLTSHVGLRRTIRRTADGSYIVEESEVPNEDLRNYSLDQWVLGPIRTGQKGPGWRG